MIEKLNNKKEIIFMYMYKLSMTKDFKLVTYPVRW